MDSAATNLLFKFETTLPIYVENNLPNCLIIRRLRANQGPNRFGRLFLYHPGLIA